MMMIKINLIFTLIIAYSINIHYNITSINLINSIQSTLLTIVSTITNKINPKINEISSKINKTIKIYQIQSNQFYIKK